MDLHKNKNKFFDGKEKKQEKEERRLGMIVHQLIYHHVLTLQGIVVLLLAVVLLGGILLGSLYMVKAYKLQRMDSAAKEIYVAAQNNLNAAEKSGRLAKIIEASYGKGNVRNKTGSLGYLMTVNPSDSGIGFREWKENRGNYYYVIYSPIRKNNLDSSILKVMLPEGAVNETIRTGGSYVIEYNINTARVTGVFFTDEESGFTEADDSRKGKYLNMTGSSGKKSSAESIRSGSFSGKAARKYFVGTLRKDDFVIGYCGGKVKLSKEKIVKPSISVKNGNRLRVTVTDPNYFTLCKYQQQHGETLESYITLKVKGETSKNTRMLRLNLRQSGRSDDYMPVNSGEQYWSAKKIRMTRKGKKIRAMQYTVDFDDITRRGGHFYEIFCSGHGKSNLIPGENIQITAECSSNRVRTSSAKSRTVSCNSLFASVKANKYDVTKEEAHVANIRHLENLNSDVSRLPEEIESESSTSSGNYCLVTNVKQIRDINWNDFAAENIDKVNNPDVPVTIFTSGKVKFKKGLREISGGSKMTSGSFYGIFNYNLREYDGNKKTIKNLEICYRTGKQESHYTAETGTNARAAGSLTDVGKGDAGLFRRIGSAVTIKDLILKNVDAEGSDSAGALIGEIASLQDGETSSSTVMDKAQITGDITVSNVLIDGGHVTSDDAETVGAAGGLIGSSNLSNIYGGGNDWADGKLKVKDCVSTAYVRSDSGDAGGLIGRVTSPSIFRRSYSGGHTRNGKYSLNDGGEEGYCNVSAPVNRMSEDDTPAAGGFIGKLSNARGSVFDRCYSTCSVKGLYAGGFIGYDSARISSVSNTRHSSYSKCYSTGLVGGYHAGAFAGKIKDSDMNEVFYLSGINGEMKGSGSGNIKGINPSAYNDIEGIAAIYPETVYEKPHVYDASLMTAIRYPFTMVNRTGAKDRDIRYIHYGDWEIPKKEKLETHLDNSRILAYQEKSGKDGKIHWYYIKSYQDSRGHTHVDEYRSLDNTPKGYIHSGDAAYGILTPSSKFPYSQFTAAGAAGFDKKGKAVNVDGSHLYFYKINDVGNSDNKGRQSMTDYWYFDKSHKKPVRFIFNDKFAAAISYNDWNYGYSGYPYEIRTSQQLHNAGDKRFRDASFILTKNIDLSAFTEIQPIISGTFTGRFVGNGYSIRNMSLKVSSGNAAGLFEKNKGEIRNVRIDGKISGNFKYGNVGLLAAVNDGTITSCSAKAKISINGDNMFGTPEQAADYDNAVNIGGLVGNAEDGSIIRSGAEGTISLKLSSSKLKEIAAGKIASSSKSPYVKRIGGFAGNVGTAGSLKVRISDCFARMDLSWNTGAKTGGFAGYMTDTIDTRVSNCYASAKYESTLEKAAKSASSEEKSKNNKKTSKSEESGTAAKKLLAVQEDQTGLFTGYDEQVLKKYTSCHAVERISGETAKKDKLKRSAYDFMNSKNKINYALDGKNYVLSRVKQAKKSNIIALTAGEYRKLSNFKGFSSSVWEITNGLYPTLKKNQE